MEPMAVPGGTITSLALTPAGRPSIRSVTASLKPSWRSTATSTSALPPLRRKVLQRCIEVLLVTGLAENAMAENDGFGSRNTSCHGLRA